MVNDALQIGILYLDELKGRGIEDTMMVYNKLLQALALLEGVGNPSTATGLMAREGKQMLIVKKIKMFLKIFGITQR